MTAFTSEQEAYIKSVAGGHSTALFAYAGSGKTHATIEAVVRLHKAQPHRTILLVTYNVRIKQEIEAKLTRVFGSLPRSISVRTMNSVGYGILMANKFAGNNELETDAYKVSKMIREAMTDKLVLKVLLAANKSTAKARRLEEHEIAQFMEEVISTAKLYGVRPESVNDEIAKRLFESAGEKTGIPPDVLRINPNMLKLITNLLLYNIDLARGGVIDFNDQIYLAALYCPSPGRQWATVIADEIQDFSSLFWMILKRVSRSQLCAIGDPFQCQPAGTMVRLPDGQLKRIERIRVGDEYTTYSLKHSHMVNASKWAKRLSGDGSTIYVPNTRGGAASPRIEATEKRKYDGHLVKVTLTNAESSRYTPEHICVVRIPKGRYLQHVYLMQKGTRVRVGVSSTPMTRVYMEKPDAMWILKSFVTRDEAHLYEHMISAKYGIPEVVFSSGHELSFRQSTAPKRHLHRWKRNKDAFLKEFWDHFPDLISNRDAVLAAHNLDARFPITDSCLPVDTAYYARWENGAGKALAVQTAGKTAYIRAVNLIPGFHQLCYVTPFVAAGSTDTVKGSRNVAARKSVTTWLDFEKTKVKYKGYVYSLQCSSNSVYSKVYIADNILTHNCIFRSVNGADVAPFEKFAKEPKVKRYELTRTFRCARVIAERQVEFGPLSKFIPHAGKKAPMGEVLYPYIGPKFAGFPKDIKNKTATAPWSFIDAAPKKRTGSIGFLASTNAMLIEATALAVKDEPVFMRSMVYCGQVYPLSRWNIAAEYISRPARAPSNLLAAMAMFMKLTGSTAKEAVDFFNARRNEEYRDTKVVFSTVHSWKGRECDTIYLIEASTLNGDTNLKYVAETRARTKLCDLKLGWHTRVNKNKWLSGYFIDTDRPVRAITVKALIKSLLDGIPHKFKADEKVVMASIKKGKPPSFVDG